MSGNYFFKLVFLIRPSQQWMINDGAESRVLLLEEFAVESSQIGGRWLSEFVKGEGQ